MFFCKLDYLNNDFVTCPYNEVSRVKNSIINLSRDVVCLICVGFFNQCCFSQIEIKQIDFARFFYVNVNLTAEDA